MSKYKDPRWQKKRLEILERDEWRCVACGDDKSTLHVHHIAYHGDPWETPDDLLQALCEDCHTALGEHPKGGVYWTREEFPWPQPKGTVTPPGRLFRLFCWNYCPMCGSRDTRKDGNGGECDRCAHRIGPDMSYVPSRVPEGKSEFQIAMDKLMAEHGPPSASSASSAAPKRGT